jgi:aspartyl aminopeptidase
MVPLHKKLDALIQRSPDPYHAVEAIRESLGFTEFKLFSQKDLKPGKKYFLKKGGFCFAFILPINPIESFRLVGTHIDSPALKLNAKPFIKKGDRIYFDVDRSGGIMYTSWLDRDLLLSGKIVTDKGEKNVRLDSHLFSIPNCPIHIDREKNEKHAFDPTKELLPFLTSEEKEVSLAKLLKEKSVLAFDLYLTPSQPGALTGLDHQIFSSYRLDNMCSAFAAMEAIGAVKPHKSALIGALFYNDEETGSMSIEGAESPFVIDLLEQICLMSGIGRLDFLKIKDRSAFYSVDVAHAFVDGHDQKFHANHRLELGKGIVIKRNHSLHYAYNIELEANILKIMKKKSIPHQFFAPLTGKPSGSTIGPHVAVRYGIPTLDVGIAIQSMHSARESLHVKDLEALVRFIKELYVQIS